MVVGRIRDGRHAQIGDVFTCMNRFWGFLWAAIVLVVLIALASLTIVGGVLLATVWIYVFPFMVDRKMGLTAAMSASYHQVVDNGFWEHLALIVVFFAIGAVANGWLGDPHDALHDRRHRRRVLRHPRPPGPDRAAAGAAGAPRRHGGSHAGHRRRPARPRRPGRGRRLDDGEWRLAAETVRTEVAPARRLRLPRLRPRRRLRLPRRVRSADEAPTADETDDAPTAERLIRDRRPTGPAEALRLRRGPSAYGLSRAGSRRHARGAVAVARGTCQPGKTTSKRSHTTGMSGAASARSPRARARTPPSGPRARTRASRRPLPPSRRTPRSLRRTGRSSTVDRADDRRAPRRSSR